MPQPKTPLSLTHPLTAALWHPSKNGELTPNDVTYGLNTKVHWKGSCGHEWERRVAGQVALESKIQCPECARVVKVPANPLSRSHPLTATLWHPSKNGDRTPDNVTAHNQEKAHWIGGCGHEWERAVRVQTPMDGRISCPDCKKSGNLTKAPKSPLSSTHPEVTALWHPTKNGNLTPDLITHGVRQAAHWKGSCGHEWSRVVSGQVAAHKANRICPKCPKTATLNETHPEVAALWHPTKNGDLTPTTVTHGSEKTINWIGECGHEWSRTPVQQTKAKSVCPTCAGNKTLEGFNTLSATHPKTAALWHPTKNAAAKVALATATAGMATKTWWLGECGHEWERAIINQTKTENKGSQPCIYCSGRTILEGYNDLATTHPTLAAEWHPENQKTPKQVSAGAGYKATWVCPEGHTYIAAVFARASYNKTGCPACSGRSAVEGKNDLKTVNPDLAAEWHPTKNNDLRPEDFLPKSHTSVWWLTSCGHEWKTSISNRSAGKGCPVCSNNVIIAGVNDALTVTPELGDWFAADLNEDPEVLSKVSRRSSEKVWWRCLENPQHIFHRPVSEQLTAINACTVCPAITVITGVNDLLTRFPELKQVWDFDLNTANPTKLRAYSEEEAYWICDEYKHSSKNKIINVVQSLARSQKFICNICNNRAVDSRYNSLAGLRPEIAEMWHPTRNGDLTPEDVHPGSPKDAWWRCIECDAEYQKSVIQKVKYPECPKCGKSQSAGERGMKELIVSTIPEQRIAFNERSLLTGYELDALLPDLGVALEFNGIYWHSETARPNTNYHLEKLEAAERVGITLFQIWEDDWMFRRPAVEAIILNALGAAAEPIGLAVTRTSNGETEAFLDVYSVNEDLTGDVHYSLINPEGVIVGALIGSVEGNIFNIKNFASTFKNKASLELFLTQIESDYPDASVSITDDHCASIGQVLSELGFLQSTVHAPDFTYMKGQSRSKTLHYDEREFIENEKLKHEEGATLDELHRMNHMHRVWNAGTSTWVK